MLRKKTELGAKEGIIGTSIGLHYPPPPPPHQQQKKKKQNRNTQNMSMYGPTLQLESGFRGSM